MDCFFQGTEAFPSYQEGERSEMKQLLKELLMGTKRKPAKQAHVEAKMASEECLIHGCQRSCGEPGGGRGRCSKHFAQFRRSLTNLPLEESMSIELQLIRSGLLLDSHEIREFRSKGVA